MLTRYFSPLKDADIIERSMFILINFLSSKISDQNLSKMFSKLTVLKSKDKRTGSLFLDFFRLISMMQLGNRQTSDMQMSSTIDNGLIWG